jgi:methylmalonyl-CoA mutase C-terminal domain/subunit
MGSRKVRILLAKLGEGHKEALLNLAKAFSEAGFEVIYTELREPGAIVKSAIQESVDHIGITTLPGADDRDFAVIFEMLAKENAGHITVSAGGYLEEARVPGLLKLGVMAFFPLGTTFDDLIAWGRRHVTIKETA